MPSVNAPSAGIASPTSDQNECGPDEPLGILLRSLAAAEAGQAGTEEVVPSEGARRDTQEAGQIGIDNAAPGKSVQRSARGERVQDADRRKVSRQKQTGDSPVRSTPLK
jgi:hypothetical protein